MQSVITSKERSSLVVDRAGEAEVRRVIFLGTGDSLDGEQAQASLAVPLSGGESMLINASSGTMLLRQLRDVGIPLKSVRNLLVSQHHFDRAGGLAPLLIALATLPEDFLTVHATSGTLEALKELLNLIIPGVEGWLGERLRWAEFMRGKPTTVLFVGKHTLRILRSGWASEKRFACPTVLKRALKRCRSPFTKL
jgi:glyoxylase-like metal-dependent hydrolase (beta-lactamase superfamily II)